MTVTVESTYKDTAYNDISDIAMKWLVTVMLCVDYMER